MNSGVFNGLRKDKFGVDITEDLGVTEFMSREARKVVYTPCSNNIIDETEKTMLI